MHTVAVPASQSAIARSVGITSCVSVTPVFVFVVAPVKYTRFEQPTPALFSTFDRTLAQNRKR